jgi:hypothetical protein
MAAPSRSSRETIDSSDPDSAVQAEDPGAFAAWHEAHLAALCERICAGVAPAQTVIDDLKAKREPSKSPRVQAARSTIRRAKRCRSPQVTPPDQAGRSPRLP